VDRVVDANGDVNELRVALDPADTSDTRRVVVFSAPFEHFAELTPVLEALAEQAGSALARIDLIARLRADERERYFRTLVLTSTDVILISRSGHIDYATPSARAMFGRDVKGEAFEEVVQRDVADRDTVDGGGDRNVETEARKEIEADADRAGQDTDARDAGFWSRLRDGAEGEIRRPDGSTVAVLVHRRDLTDDPTVNGVVTTLRDVTAERDLRRSLAYRASHDALTGLANADLLRDQLRRDREMDRLHPNRSGLAVVLFIDLDDFKSVNDSYGHEIGDGVLATVARRIQICLRHNDMAARLGGDEFAVLFRDVPDVAAANAAAQRIADALSRPANVAGIAVDCQASIGLAIARTPGEFDSLLRRADTALYTAKADGKGQWRSYHDAMISPVRRRTDLRDELDAAIKDDKLTLHYQPIVDMTTGRARGFEALIRFDRVSRPPMEPEELIAIAEDNALILPLGDWILRRALADVGKLNRATDDRAPDPPRYVSVNVSVRQLRQPGFADTVRAHLATSGVAASMLVIEITESLLLSEDERAWGYLAELRRDGVRIAIDDYGTGYASLSYLRQSAIDIIKIDRRFLTDLVSDRSRILLEALLEVTGKLGLEQIAEGVEDPYARDVLVQLGCRYGQGFLYAHAMPAAQANLWGLPGVSAEAGGGGGSHDVR
jgi:diguanylate cyclase (GGDEF)-like protein